MSNEKAIMKLTPIDAKTVKENAAGSYNFSVWEETVSSYEKYNGKFYISDKRNYNSDEFYAIYIADGIRFMQKISFSNSLTNSALQMYIIEDNGELKSTDYVYPKNKYGRELARRMTKQKENTIFI